MGTLTPNYQLQVPTLGADQGPQYAIEVNASIGIVDSVLGGVQIVSVAAGATIALTTTQIQSNWIKLTGAPSISTLVQFPSGVGGRWIVSNNTTGAGAVSVQTAGGTSILIPQGLTYAVISDGTNMQLPSEVGWQLLTKQTVNTATLVLALPATYSRFRLTAQNLFISVSGAFLMMQVSSNGGSSYLSSGYANGIIVAAQTITTTPTFNYSAGYNGIILTGGIAGGNTFPGDVTVEIFPGSTTSVPQTKSLGITQSPTTGFQMEFRAGNVTGAGAAINSVQLFVETAQTGPVNGTWSGTIWLEGMA